MTTANTRTQAGGPRRRSLVVLATLGAAGRSGIIVARPMPDHVDLSAFEALVPLDHGLCVVSSLRRDGTIQSSVVNAGVLEHPLTGLRVVGLVAAGGSRKLANLRRDPRATIVARATWRWAAVEGTADIIGPDDPHPDVDGEHVRALLRDIFRVAGGTHDDWDTYDRVMADERRAAVLLTPTRSYTNRLT